MSEPAGALTLLVVDDEPAWVGALGAVLGKAGHRIVAAYDGAEALRRFRSEPVDAVLLDLAMPNLDGDRCRVGDCRIIYDVIVEDRVVLVYGIVHRSDLER